jgi:hypothetical protein
MRSRSQHAWSLSRVPMTWERCTPESRRSRIQELTKPVPKPLFPNESTASSFSNSEYGMAVGEDLVIGTLFADLFPKTGHFRTQSGNRIARSHSYLELLHFETLGTLGKSLDKPLPVWYPVSHNAGSCYTGLCERNWHCGRASDHHQSAMYIERRWLSIAASLSVSGASPTHRDY